MPSPFPGMDPFIEGQCWRDFHHRIIGTISDALTPEVLPRYVVRIDEHVYVTTAPPERADLIYPNVVVLERSRSESTPASPGGPAATATVEPVVLTLPRPERVREAYLTVRRRETLEVVTVIEVLSPTNKRPGSDGQYEYLQKRDEVLGSTAHLVELDLLRGGERLPTVEPLPGGDYYCFIALAGQRPKPNTYAWTMRRALPTIPIPLAEGDTEVALDIQAVFSTVYDRAAYAFSLDYSLPVEPRLEEADATWVQEVLAAADRGA
jgi:hypothetical protein